VDRFGNIYVSDYAAFGKVSSSGWVSTLAGSVNFGYADGNGRSARFNSCTGLCVDSNGIVYVADTGNHTIRKIVPLVVLNSISVDASGLITLRWDSATNRIYSVQFSDDLTNWSTLGGSITGTGAPLSTTDSIALNHFQRFMSFRPPRQLRFSARLEWEAPLVEVGQKVPARKETSS